MATSKDLLKLKGEENVLLVVGQKKKIPEQLKTFQVPPSSVLQQARSFLPQLATANAALEEKMKTVPAAQMDIENIDDCRGNVIEMNLAVVENEESDSSDSNFSSDSESECHDSGSMDLPLFLGHLTPDNLKKPAQHAKRPTIEIMTDLHESSETMVSENSTNDSEKVIFVEKEQIVDTERC